MSEGFTKKEVVWPLHKLKMKAAAENDGLTAEMMNREVVVELWWELFNWCWVSGMVPSVWRTMRGGVLSGGASTKEEEQESL